MKKIMLRESQAPYTLTLDEKTLTHESVILERDGQPVAALVPTAEYEAFHAWQQAQERRRLRQAPGGHLQSRRHLHDR